MTRAVYLESPGSLRRYSSGSYKVMEMQGNANRIGIIIGSNPVSGSSGGKVEASVKPEQPRLRPIGLCRGQFTVPADFDDSLPDDILEEFEGR
jgi:hypothetical protein